MSRFKNLTDAEARTLIRAELLDRVEIEQAHQRAQGRCPVSSSQRDDERVRELLDEYGRVLATAREEFTAAYDRIAVLAEAERDADREAGQ